jgi:hypothetical protein
VKKTLSVQPTRIYDKKTFVSYRMAALLLTGIGIYGVLTGVRNGALR